MESMLLPILMFAGLGALLYFSSKKQKRVAAATRAMHDALVPGTRVMTTSGLHGTITAVADDTIELEIAPGLRTTWVRAAIREIVVAAPLDAEDRESLEEAGIEVVDADDAAPTDPGVNIRKSNDLN
jgi:preprotein translocase subunit YajC